MSQKSSIKLNISQNHFDLKLKPFDEQLFLFKKRLFKKDIKSYTTRF